MMLKIQLLFLILNSFISFNQCNNAAIVNTTSGVVKGLNIHVLNTSIAQYLSIPYAEPPVGRLRFAKPEPLKHPKQLIDGTIIGNSCWQLVNNITKDFIGNLTKNEDCLVINVWTPNTNANHNNETSNVLKPVMFWIHGGALILGSSFQKQYNASALAAHDVVVVSINYRLGWFGFFYGDNESAPGNVGLFDQVLALQWVRDNIHNFGGDKDQITIFGESAGSWSVSTLLLSPYAKGLYKRAIMESGAEFFNKLQAPVDKNSTLDQCKQLAKYFNCSDSQWLDCLRKVDAEDIIDVEDVNLNVFPLLETQFLPMSPQKALQTQQFNKDLDIMAGVAKHEGSILLFSTMGGHIPGNLTRDDFIGFAQGIDSVFHNLNATAIAEVYVGNKTDSNDLLWAEFELFGDLMITCPTYQFAKNYAKHTSAEHSNVYFYEITYHRTYAKGNPMTFLDVSHGAELPFVFGLPLIDPQKTDTEIDVRFSRDVMKMWINFAKYGKPDNKWPKLVDPINPKRVPEVYNLNPIQRNEIFSNLFKNTCDGLWQNYYN
ncbi:cholinesterase-like [Oppia nitens]|uniref:cholinesterase-like n=1 Tax=Oppia nitens TaxID=1686743 RepID=UPI0023DC253F|nr:cholinesterase-like [Oppia nitens]